MKKLLLILFLSSYALNAQTDSILFIGNSFTFTEDVPGKLQSLAQSGGKNMYIESYCPPGKQLSEHYTDPTTIAKINSRKWTYVVLQEQSQMPYISGNTTKYYANHLVLDYIKPHNPCTEVIVYATWARKQGEAWLLTTGLTHDQMATYYENFYANFYQNTTGRVSAVGTAFHKATKQGIEMYSTDGYHQNADGTYLAACVFYATIYKESPLGLTFSSASTALIKTQLQQIANDVVMNHLYDYNINKVRWSMSKTNINVGESINYTEGFYMEPYPNSITWTFEGANPTTSNAENPANITYNNSGLYNVSLSITDACGLSESRTFTDTITVNNPTAIEILNEKSLRIFPNLLNQNNPTFEILNINEINLDELKIYNVSGQTISYKINGNKITLQNEISGVIYVKAKDKVSKLIIE